MSIAASRLADASHTPAIGKRRRVLTCQPLSRYLGATVLLGILALSVVVPLISASPDNFVAQPLQPPSWSHLFGTDEFGRDIFVRTFAAGRVDLFVVVAGVTTSLLFGTAVGVLVTAAKRRVWETVLMRIVDSILAFPFIVLVLALVLIFGATRWYCTCQPACPHC